VALLASAMFLTGCTHADQGGGDPAEPSDSASASTSSNEPVTLRFAVYGVPESVTAYRAMADAYMRRRPNVTIKVVASPDASTQAGVLDRQFASGNAPDLFLTDSTRMPALVAANRVQPVDELLEQRGITFGDSYERLGLEAMAANSALQCMPSDVSPEVVFFNKRLLDPGVLQSLPDKPDPAQTGWTWEQFLAAARRTSNDRVKGVYLSPQLTTLAPLLRSAGTDIVDDPKRPTTLTLSAGSAQDPLDQILNLVRNHRLSPTRAELARQGALSRFENGRLAMMTGTRALVPELRRKKDLVFDVYPLPSLSKPETVADVSGYCINRRTRHLSAAADFLAFASGDRGSALVARSGAVVPANLNALQTPSYLEPNRFPINVDVFTRVIRRADTMPNPPAWQQVVNRTQPLIDRLFYASAPDLQRTLPRIDRISARILAQPTPSPSPSG
jgi:multiple sugar transport system substrate-binding protein